VTRLRARKRHIPLEPEAADILRTLAGEGPVFACFNHVWIKTRELAPERFYFAEEIKELSPEE
jgi:hypothetical protein